MATINGVDRPAEADRRVFLARTAMCAGGLLCLGCARATAAGQQPAGKPAAQADKFAADSRMTFRDVWAFAYARNVIPLLTALAEDIGREKFVATVQATAFRAATEATKKSAPPPPRNTLTALTTLEPEYLWSHVLTLDWVEKTEKAVEIRVTECLWAATFRDAGAADIGYAVCCNPDFAAASAFNPKIRLTRTKTLMQGHDCCNHRYVLQA